MALWWEPLSWAYYGHFGTCPSFWFLLGPSHRVDGKALMVPLLNPKEVIKKGGKARLGEPITLNLGGLGFRDMVRWHDSFLIIAGDFVDRFAPGAKPSRVFSWKPGAEPKDIGVDFHDLNPEAIMIMGDGYNARILILSDDGAYPGRGHKNAFRGVWLQ